MFGRGFFGSLGRLRWGRRKNRKAAKVITERLLRVEPLEKRQLLSITTLYYDPNGSSGLGGNGTWSPTSAVWSTSASGGGTLQAWTPSCNGDIAVFSGAAGTVTLAPTSTSPISASLIQFNPSGYSIVPNSSNPLPLTVPQNGTMITTANGNSESMSAAVTGPGGMSFCGASGGSGGSFTLSGANTSWGGVSVNTGNLVAANSSALGNGLMEVDSGGKLTLNANVTIYALGGYGTIQTTGYTLTVDTGSGAAAVNSSFGGTLSGSGSGGLNVNASGSGPGTGTLTLTGNNSGYSQEITVTSGTLDLEGLLKSPWSSSVLTVYPSTGGRVVGADSPLSASISGPTQQGSVFQFTGTATENLAGGTTPVARAEILN